MANLPLYWRLKNGHELVVKLLIEQNVNIEVKDNDGWTPLSWAAENGHEEVVKLLLGKNADAESEDINGWTPLLWAATNGYEGEIRLLLEKVRVSKLRITKAGRTSQLRLKATSLEEIRETKFDSDAFLSLLRPFMTQQILNSL